MPFTGLNTPPYRLPCTGGRTRLVNGSCYQHKRASEKSIPVFANTSKVGGNIPTSGSGGPVDSCGEAEGTYRSPNRLADGNCFESTPQVTVTNAEITLFSSSPYTIPHPYVDLASIVIKSADGSITYQYGVEPSGGTPGNGDWSIADPTQSTIQIYRLSTTSTFADGASLLLSYRTGLVDLSTCHKTGWKAVRAVKFWHGRRPFTYCGCADDDGTKYLTSRITVTAAGSGTLISQQWNYADTQILDVDDTYSMSGTCEITGSVSKSTGLRSGSGCLNNDFYTVSSPYYNAEGTESYPFYSPADLRTMAGDLSNCVQPFSTSGYYTISGPESYTPAFENGNPIPWEQGSEDPDENGYWSYKRELGSTSDTFTVAGTTATRTISNTWDMYHSWKNADGHGLWSNTGSESYTITWELDAPYTLADVGRDCAALLYHWDLANDKQIGWRQDALCLRVPVIRTNELQTAVQPANLGCTDGIHNTDTNTASTDIIGAPNPVGYGYTYSYPRGHYSVKQPVKLSGIWQEGQWQPDYLPLAATYWTTADEESTEYPMYPGGAFIMVSEEKVVMQKYAVTKEIAPSLNFYRPCGPDRLLTNGDERDPVVLYPDAWPICGRVKVNMDATWTSEGSSYTNIELDEPAPGIQDGDQLDFLNYDGDGNEIDIVTRTVLYRDSDTQIKLSGASDPDRQWVKSHASPAYYWNDNQPKGDYTVQQWTTNTCQEDGTTSNCSPPGPTTHTCQDGCLPRNICHPSVICLSPNAAEPEDWDSEEAYIPIDVFPHGHTYPLPSPQANTLWHGLPVPDIADPIWRGTGTPPRAESRCARPTGAPESNCSLCMNLPCPNLDDIVCPAIPCGSCEPGDIWI